MTVSAETARVMAVRDLRIMDTAPEPEYDRLVRIASHIAKSSEAHICFIDDKQQYIKALQGAEFERTISREKSICEAVVSLGAPILIPDLAADPLPKRRAIAEQYGLRSYVGMPIILPEGHAVGVLAVMSEAVGICSQRRLDALQDLTQIAARELVIRRLSGIKASLFAPARLQQPSVSKAIAESHARVLQAISDGILGFRGDGTINFVNPSAERILGRSADALLGMTFAEALRTPDLGERDRNCPVAACIQNGSERFVPSARFLHASGASIQVEFVVSPLQSNGRTTGAIVVFRDTTGVALTNGVELRKSLREVARLKEQVVRLEAHWKNVGSPGATLSDFDWIDRPNFAQLTAALDRDKAEQIRRAEAVLQSWADRPRLVGGATGSPDAAPGGVGAGTPSDEKKLTRIERWLADQVAQHKADFARSSSSGQNLALSARSGASPTGGSARR